MSGTTPQPPRQRHGFDAGTASIAGFADVLGVMAVALWLGSRHHRRTTAVEKG